MSVHEALKDALYSFNKIALPGFGTFVTDYSPAYIHPTQHLCQPPYKKISFAPELKTDDNLLLTYLMEFNKVNADTARKEIEAFVRDIQYKLSVDNKYSIEGVGEWYYDIEKQLLFKANASINFMKEAYGLPPFVAEPVTRKSTIPAKTAPAVTKSKESAGMARISYIILALVVVAIGVYAALHFTHLIKY